MTFVERDHRLVAQFRATCDLSYELEFGADAEISLEASPTSWGIQISTSNADYARRTLEEFISLRHYRMVREPTGFRFVPADWGVGVAGESAP